MPIKASRRFVVLLLGSAFVFGFLFVSFFSKQPASTSPSGSRSPAAQIDVSPETLRGGVIAPKLGNETIKAELGRAAWKVLHTTMARFPDAPTPDESVALQSYIHLFARLYPCGECAGHFQQILEQFPPQVSSRSSAAAWACHVHNEVNKSLNKELFDCSNIGDFYDCGCAEDGDEQNGKGAKLHAGHTTHEHQTKDTTLKLEKEGLTAGG